MEAEVLCRSQLKYGKRKMALLNCLSSKGGTVHCVNIQDQL